MPRLGIVDGNADVLLQTVLGIDHEANRESDDAALLHPGRYLRGRQEGLILAIDEVELTVIGLPYESRLTV